MTKPSFAKAISWNLAGSAARVLVTLVCQLILLRHLGPVIAGQFAVFLVIVGIGTTLSDGGMIVALTRDPAITRDKVGQALYLSIGYSVSIFVVLALSSGFIAQLFRLKEGLKYILLIGAANVLPLGLSTVPLSLLRREYKSREVQFIQLSSYAVGFGMVALPLSFLDHSVNVLLLGFTLQSLLSMALGFRLSRCPLYIRRKGAAAMRTTGLKAVLTNIAYFINEAAPNVLTAHYIGTKTLGIYGTAFNLLRMPTDVIVTTVHAPLLVSAAQDTQGELTRSRLLSTVNLLATVVFSGYLFVFFTGNQLVVPLLGTKWIEAGPVLSVMGLLMMSRLLSMVSGAVVWGHGRLSLDLLAQSMSALTTLIGFLLFRPRSANEVAWIVLVGLITRMLMQGIVAAYSCRISFRAVAHALIGPTLITACLMSPIVLLTVQSGPVVARLGLLVLGSGALFLLRILLALRRSRYRWALAVKAMILRLVAWRFPIATLKSTL